MIDAKAIQTEYASGKRYNDTIELTKDVTRNENFYEGAQWEGIMAPDLPKPVLNILRRVVSYFISTLVSDDVAAQVSEMGKAGMQNLLLDNVQKELAQVVEQEDVKNKMRDALRDAAVDGDCCLHTYFDTGVKTGELTDGVIRVELLENTNVFFGNRSKRDPQDQPYIIIARSDLLSEVKRKAQEAGVSNYEEIVADDEDGEKDDTEKVTVVRKYWRSGGTIHVCEIAGEVVLLDDTDTGMTRYPIAWMNWERRRKSYHGKSCMTAVIPNQIDINRLFAMCIKQVKDGAFPKLIYNENLFPDGWSNKISEAVGVRGDVREAMTMQTGQSEMSPQVITIIHDLIQLTKETMGASDAALGQVKADNTSAIIAVQQASNMPLELQKREMYALWESLIRNMIDMMAAYYGIRRAVEDENGMTQQVDFGALKEMRLKLEVSVGESAYWSALATIATLDNLFSRGILSDAEVYIDMIPQAVLPQKAKLLEEIKKQKEAAEIQAQQQNVPPEMMEAMA